MPTRELPPEPSLEHLRNQAKDLRRQVVAGDAAAVDLVRELHPRLTEVTDAGALTITLADAQLVIARLYEFESWPKLRRHIDVLTRYSRSPHRQPTDGPTTAGGGTQAAEFLRLVCLTYGGGAVARRTQARELLASHPEIATVSIHTMAAVGDVAAAAVLLAEDPTQANALGGPYEWEPLLYLAYSRLTAPLPATPPWRSPGCCWRTARTPMPATCGRAPTRSRR